MGWLVLGLRPAGARGGRSDSKEVWEQRPKSECPPRAPMAERSGRNGGACAHEGVDRGRSPQSVCRCRGGERGRRVRRGCPLLAEPSRLEGPLRTLVEAVPRAPLGGGERWRPRQALGAEVGSSRRVRGGRASEAFGARAGALHRQLPQKR